MRYKDIEFDIEKDGTSLIRVIKSLFRKKRDKSNTFILFIDDDEFPIVDYLHKGGWAVERVEDISSIDEDVVKRAQIIFIDNKGVGKILAKSGEGIGLAKLIKKTYGEGKRVILYSGHLMSVVEDLKVVDNYLEKDADTYQFELKIKEELGKLR